jgi:hypothetical protein
VGKSHTQDLRSVGRGQPVPRDQPQDLAVGLRQRGEGRRDRLALANALGVVARGDRPDALAVRRLGAPARAPAVLAGEATASSHGSGSAGTDSSDLHAAANVSAATSSATAGAARRRPKRSTAG